MSQYVIGIVTCASGVEARKLAGLILRRKLAACVNILRGIESHYWWQGKLEKADEVMLLIKTKEAHIGILTKAIKVAHSYETPEIIFVSITKGERNYLKWLGDSVR